MKTCNGEGARVCDTIYETSCYTKYIELQPGKLGTNTNCEKIPLEVCGHGCSYKEGENECHDEAVMSFIQIPEEVCELNPQKTCRFTTKLVPKLEPVKECTVVTKETCQLAFSKPKPIKKPLTTKWCLEKSHQKLSEKKENSVILDRGKHLNNRDSKKVDIEIIPEKNISIENPTLNTRNKFLSFEGENTVQNKDDKNVQPVFNKNKVKPGNIAGRENPILDVRFGLSSETSIVLHNIKKGEMGQKIRNGYFLNQDKFQTKFNSTMI